MKKVLAIMFALMLMFSFAACGKDSKDSASTTTVAPAATNGAQVVTPTQAQVVTPTQAQVVTPTQAQVVTPATGTLEAWVAANQTALNSYLNEQMTSEFVDEIGATSATATVSATGNKLNITVTVFGLELTDDMLADLAMAQEEMNAEIAAMTAEEKAEEMANFPEAMAEIGLTGAPTPEGMAMYMFTDAGVLLYNVEY